MIAPALSPAILPPILGPLDRLPGPMANVIPGRDQLATLFVQRDGVWTDIIGLSAAALWAALPTTHRSIYLVDENTLRSAEDIISNIEASGYLNDGGELVGTAKEYAQYAEGTDATVLQKAHKYFDVSYYGHPPYTGRLLNYRAKDLSLSDGTLVSSWSEHYGGSAATQSTDLDKPFFIHNAVDGHNAVQFREGEILNLPAGLSVHGRSISVFFISRTNHAGIDGEKIYAAIGGGINWLYKSIPSPNTLRIALYSEGNTLSSQVLSNQIQLHGIGCSATKRKTWANNQSSESTTLSINSTLTGGTIGGGFSEGYYPSLDMLECLVYDHLLTDSEYAELLAYANAAYGIGYASKTKQVLFMGNSLMSGFSVVGNGTIPNRYAAVAPSNVKTYNLGQDSINITQLIAAASTNIDNLYDATLAKNIVCLWEGRNELAAGKTKEETLANYITLCQGRKAAGFKVVVGTILPSGGTFEVDRAYVNSAIVNDFVSSGYADAVADVASDSTIGEEFDNENATYYSDSVHLTSAGAAIAVNYFINAINSIID